MYLVYCDETKIYDLFEDLILIDPVIELELNSPGTFTFTMPSDHPYYDLPQRMSSRITVYHDDEELFKGRVISEGTNFYNERELTCEGELGFLNDSIQRPAEYHDMTVRDYFKTLIEQHNEQVEEDKRFEIGIVTISDENDSIFRYTNYNSTMTEMKEDLVDDFGGYIRVRNQDGHRYLDYVKEEDYGVMNEQPVRFGVNLLDYSSNMDASDIATVIIPLGEQLEESPIEALNMRLTIESVNGGSDAIESEEAVKTYGRIVKTVIWDDVTVASNLLTKGKDYLSDYQWDNMILEVSAVDLHDADAQTECFHLGDQIRVISSPHGLDRYFVLSGTTIHLDAPDQNTYKLGTEVTGKTLTERVKSTTSQIDRVESEITPTQAILNQAKEQATNLINAATHGYVIVEPDEILIMNTDDKETATKVWRWNINGLGYSSTGYSGTFGLAMTMDGAIVADYITTGTLTASLIKTGKLQDVKGTNSWDMDNGTMTISTKQFTLDSSGNATFSGSLSAATGSFSGSLSAATGSFSGSITSTSGTIGGWTIGTSALYNGTSSTTSTTNGTYIGTNGIRQYSSGNYMNLTSATLENGNSSGDYAKLTTGTLQFAKSNNLIGTFGTSYWVSSTSLTGLHINLEYGCNYISFGRKESSSASTYTAAYLISYSTRIEDYRHNFYGTANFNNNVYTEAGANVGIGTDSLGSYALRVNGAAYASGGWAGNSDETLKNDIKPLSEKTETFIDKLNPVSFSYKDDEDQKIHFGVTYQNVCEALEAEGIDPKESGVVSTAPDENGEEKGTLFYDELIAPVIYEVKELKAEVASLKAELEELKAQLI